ncbi:unnamed protein product [Withania somnifera]
MATKTRDIPLLVKGKRSPSTTKTQSLVVTNAINLIASNRKNIYLKSKVCSSHDKTQGKKPTPSTYANIHHKQTLNHRTSIDKAPSSFDNTQVKKNATLSNDPNIVQSKPNITRGSLFDNRPFTPSSFDKAQGKKLASSSSCVPPSIHNKQTLARRRLLFDHRPPPPSSRDNSPQSKKLVPRTSHVFSLLKNRTSSNPKERILKPPLSSSSKNSNSQKPLLNKLFKDPHTSNKDVTGKEHGAGLYDKTVNRNKTITKKQDSATGLIAKEIIITSHLTDSNVANIDPHEDEELKHEEYQELNIEDDEDLSETVNIDEYLKAAESSPLYVVENQQVMEVPEDQELLVKETSIIKSHKEQEEIKILEPSNENQEEKEKEKGEESETSLKALDDCQQKKEKGKELNLNTHQEEKEESDGRNNKGKEEKDNNKISTTTMAFAKAYPHLVHKKENVVSNDVIEETASKLRDQRKNRVKALASAFETVISLQDPK